MSNLGHWGNRPIDLFYHQETLIFLSQNIASDKTQRTSGGWPIFEGNIGTLLAEESFLSSD